MRGRICDAFAATKRVETYYSREWGVVEPPQAPPGYPPCASTGVRSGGEEGIRTLDTTFAVWRFSKALPSATRPPLRCRSYALNRPAGSNRKVVSRVPRGRSTHTH